MRRWQLRRHRRSLAVAGNAFTRPWGEGTLLQGLDPWSIALLDSVPGLRPADLTSMAHVTQILNAIEQGDPHAAERLLPLVYDELRQLAAQKLSQEKPGQTLQATALVHEAYLRLVDVEEAQQWDSRGHFFAAAAEAMRRILVENARHKRSEKHGGLVSRRSLDEADISTETPSEDLLALDEALTKLAD